MKMSTRLQGPPVSLPPALRPSSTILHGRTISLDHLRPEHADDLFDCIGGDGPDRAWLWDYMLDGPYEDRDALRASITAKSSSVDPFFFAIIDNTGLKGSSKGKVVGYFSLMRITPDHLTLEIGNILFSPSMQRTAAATEAIYVLTQYAFKDLRYRRIEWKCNALNEPSRRAALRLGYTFEGIFRQHMIVRGRNRDTAWYSMLKDEWDGWLGKAMEQWLDVNNFDADGKQKKKLEEFRNDIRPAQ